MDALAEIRKLYYRATRATIQKDLARAIELLKSMPSDEERERAAVYMDGLMEMRKEWAPRKPAAADRRRPTGKPRRRNNHR